MSASNLTDAQREELNGAAPPLRICTNRHPECSGSPWGWVEDAKGRHLAFWSGERQAEREAIAARVAEINAAGRAALAGAK